MVIMERKYAIARLLHLSGIAALSRQILTRKGRYVLMLHDVVQQHRDDMPPRSYRALSVDEMHRMLSWLQQNVHLLTPEELFQSDKPGVLLTFDDGKANNYTHLLPLLEHYNAPALVFVTTQHVRDPENWISTTRHFLARKWSSPADVPDEIAREYYDGMSQEQVIACDQHPLVTIGAHTESHPHLTRCDDEQLMSELVQSRAYLERLLGHPVETFSYPYGAYDRRVIEAVCEAGYRYAFAINTSNAGLPQYEIPRLHIEIVEPYYLSTKLSGLFKPPIKEIVCHD